MSPVIESCCVETFAGIILISFDKKLIPLYCIFDFLIEYKSFLMSKLKLMLDKISLFNNLISPLLTEPLTS